MPLPRVGRGEHCLYSAGRNPIVYNGTRFGNSFKADIVVAHQLMLEIKAVTATLAIHEMQLRQVTT